MCVYVICWGMRGPGASMIWGLHVECVVVEYVHLCCSDVIMHMRMTHAFGSLILYIVVLICVSFIHIRIHYIES